MYAKRPTVRDSIDSRGRPTPSQLATAPSTAITESPYATTAGESPYMEMSNDWNAKVVGMTEDGDVIVKIHPGFQQMLAAKLNPMSTTTLGGLQDNNPSKLEVGNTSGSD